MSCFALDPKECHGKVKPQFNFFGHPLGFEETPTFLGLKLDGQLTFAPLTSPLKEKMAKRRACLSAIAGRSHGCHRSTLRIAYQSYVRSLFDYGAVVYFTHAAPAVRELLEVEQRKCARMITGCIKLTDKETLTAEADLPRCQSAPKSWPPWITQHHSRASRRSSPLPTQQDPAAATPLPGP